MRLLRPWDAADCDHRVGRHAFSADPPETKRDRRRVLRPSVRAATSRAIPPRQPESAAPLHPAPVGLPERHGLRRGAASTRRRARQPRRPTAPVVLTKQVHRRRARPPGCNTGPPKHAERRLRRGSAILAQLPRPGLHVIAGGIVRMDREPPWADPKRPWSAVAARQGPASRPAAHGCERTCRTQSNGGARERA